MFSQTNEYALRVIAFLGASSHGPTRHADIAKGTRVPGDYLYKILQMLDRAGLVQTQRGKHGGFSLSRPPTEISIFDVVDAADPLPRIRSCPLGLKSHGLNLCPLHKRLDDAFAQIEEVFRKSLISDLLSDTSASVPLCETSTSTRRQSKARTTHLTISARQNE